MLKALGTKIFLDRYAKKSDRFAAGDGVLARHNEQALLGTVLSVSQHSVQLKLESGETITRDKSDVAKPCETLEMMFQRVSGCKGGTVYRDGSRKEQVLNRQEAADQQSIKELPYKRLGATVSMKTPSGTLHLTMNHDCEGQPFEVFIEIGKAGSSIKAMAECIRRLISLIFRLEPIPPQERALQVIEQLSGIGGARSVGFGKNKVLSLPDAVSKALAEHYRISDFGTGGSFTADDHFRNSAFPIPLQKATHDFVLALTSARSVVNHLMSEKRGVLIVFRVGIRSVDASPSVASQRSGLNGKGQAVCYGCT